MPSFQDIFMESNGKPVEYHGRTVQMMDRLLVADGQKVRIVLESANSDWRQGVHFSTDGGFKYNGQIYKNALVIWEPVAPRETMIEIKSKKGECIVKNVWDVGDGVMHSWHNGAAMIVEELISSRRYRCNDGRADDDFDDLVFRLDFD